MLRFHDVGGRPCIFWRCNGLARGIYNRLVADDRFSDGQLPPEVQ